MTCRKKLLLLLVWLGTATQAVGQSLAIFDTKLNTEKIAQCDLITKFINPRHGYEYKYFSDSFYSVSSYDNQSKIFGHWAFFVRHDSLNQLWFSSLELPINAESHQKIKALTDNAIAFFTSKYGLPIKTLVTKNNVYQTGKNYIPGTVHKAMWLVDGQKLKIDFSIGGEHGEFTYSLKIVKFSTYYANIKLPPWWDGY